MKGSAEALFDEQKDEFGRGVLVSVGAHVAILALFLLKSLLFAPKPFDIPPSIRVDIVGLPDKIEDLPAAPAPAPEPAKPAEPVKEKPKAQAKPEPKKPLPVKKDDAINLEKAKKAKEQDALNKLKSLEALDKIKDDVSAEKAESEKARLEALAKASRQKVKGNILSPGSSLNGLEKIQYDEYAGLLDRHIKPHWQMPEWLARKGYRAQVVVRADARGTLIGRQMLRSSGNPDFDQYCLETIDRAAPMPPPPEKFVAIVANQGIVVDFGEEKGSP